MIQNPPTIDDYERIAHLVKWRKYGILSEIAPEWVRRQIHGKEVLGRRVDLAIEDRTE